MATSGSVPASARAATIVMASY